MVPVIWTTSGDVTADMVERELERLGCRFLRIDTDSYGNRYSLSWRCGETCFYAPWGRVASSDVSAVWYRRPSISECPKDSRDFAVHESWYFARAALLNMPTARWMNHPAAVLTAENKLRQLEMACRIGLQVPRSLLTSDPDSAWAFYNLVPSCVCKPGFAGLLGADEGLRAVYAARVELGLQRDDFESVRGCPTFLQEEVPKAADIRLTVVGDDFFATRIRSGAADRVDWRAGIGRDLTYEAVELPASTCEQVRALMRELELSYGAIDFAERDSGELAFLEVNPAGQWGWLQEAARLPIAEAVASWLVRS
jgi:hypothetical protein